MTEHIDQLGKQKETLSADIETLHRQKTAEMPSNTGNIAHARGGRASKKAKDMEALLESLDEHPNASLSEIAESTGRLKSTAGAYVSELQDSNRLHKNGHGWMVISN